MQIARQAQPLLLDLQAGQLCPCSMQVPDCAGQASQADHVQPQPPDQQYERDQLQPINLSDASSCTHADEEWEEYQDSDDEEGAANRKQDSCDGTDPDEEPEESKAIGQAEHEHKCDEHCKQH